MQDSKRDTDVKNRLLDSVGEGKGGMIWENRTETCIVKEAVQFQCMKQGVKAGALGQLWGMGCGGRWDGEGGGGSIQDGGHMYTHGWFMSMYGKTHHNIGK